jgi:hypothetical protein
VPPAPTPTRAPNVHPACFNLPDRSREGYEELCHLVTESDPDTALCGRDVTGYPWNPPWPRCEACLAVARGQLN